MLNVLSGVAASSRAPSSFDLPAGFPWMPDFLVQRSGETFRSTYEPGADKPAGTPIWVAMTGNDGSGDGSEGNPYRTIAHARDQGDIVYIKSGFYEDDDAAFGMAVAGDTAYVAADGPGSVIWSANQDNISWALKSGDVYRATLSSTVHDVLDLTYTRDGEVLKDGVTGLPLPYDAETSIVAVQGNPGSFYYTGTTLYVHTHDSRAPNSDIKPMWDKDIWNASDVAHTLYLEGIEFWGAKALAITGHSTTPNSKIVAVDCAFRFVPSGGAALCTSIKDVRMFRCAVSDCMEDGFDYTNNSTAFTQTVLEVDCDAKRCGRASGGASNNNCSTSHKDCHVMRIGGVYDTAQGPIIADVQGSHSLCLGVNALNATSSEGDAHISDAGFSVGTYSSNDVPSRMWVFGGSTSGCGYDRAVSSGGVMICDAAFDGGAGSDAGNTVLAFEDDQTPAMFDDLTLWYDFDHDATIDLDTGGIVEVHDKSPQRINARQNTSGQRLPDPAVISGRFNGRKVTSPDDRTDEKCVTLLSSVTVGDLYIVASYKDGADSAFDS